jgi:hypothetical protein
VQRNILKSKVDAVSKQLGALKSVKGATLSYYCDGEIKELRKKWIRDGGEESV